MSLIFWMSSQPGSAIQLPKFPHSDKVVHFMAFVVLSILLQKSVEHEEKKYLFSGICLLIAILFGLSDEWHQSFVVNRHASWADFSADFLGALSGFYILVVVKKTKANK